MSGKRFDDLALIAGYLDQALELPPAEQAALLDELHGRDAALGERLARLLAADARVGTVLDGEGLAGNIGRLLALDRQVQQASLDQAWRDRMIGPYRIVRLIGQGGMASVFLAHRADGAFAQQAAIKLIRAGYDTPQLRRWFQREREILARLDHPNIARLYDGGVTDAGELWFAMAYVDGQPITAYCDKQRSPLRERLHLFLRACAAVSYAHHRLVVHRDLKPSNILVTASGEVRLLDFGIAKLLAAEEGAPEAGAELTALCGIPATPDYAAPEQIRGEPISTAADVYALGVLLYELLVGVRPYRLAQRSAAEIERTILAAVIAKPSAAATDARRRRGLAGDLDTITLKALAKTPERRYASTEAFAEDIERHLDGRPVKARPDSLAYRSGKFLRRHWVGVAAGASILLALLGGLAGTAWQTRRAELEADKVTAVKGFLLGLFDAADPERADGVTLTARQIVDQGAARLDTELAGQAPTRAELSGVICGLYDRLGLYERAVQTCQQQVALLAELYGRDDWRHAQALATLGTQRRQAGDFDGALTDQRAAVEVLRRRASPIVLANALSPLADTLHSKGRYAESESLYRESIALLRQSSADHRAELANALSEYGMLVQHMSRFEEGEALLREAVAITRAQQPSLPLDLADQLSRLSQLLRHRDKLEEAEALVNEALALDRRLLGEAHPQVAGMLHDLGVIARNRGRPVEAETYLRQSLSAFQQALGSEHVFVATALHDLGGMLVGQHRGDEARPMLQQALAIYRKQLGDEHQNVAMSYVTLGSLELGAGRLEEAERFYRQALAIYERVLAPNHALSETARLGVAKILIARQQTQAALPLLHQVLDNWRQQFGENDRRTAQAKLALARALVQMDQSEQARALLLEAQPILRDKLGAQSDDARLAERTLAELDPVKPR
jgi:eukaryotic-like serine/threonine-protein kinase